MTKKIEINFKLENKVKHFKAKETSKMSELIENLKQITEDDNINIELFYGGRFLNPNFTVQQIKYDGKSPIIVFTSSDEFKSKYELARTQLLPSFSDDDSEILKNSSILSTLDAEDFNLNKLSKYKKGIPSNTIHDLQDQASKNNVSESVMYLLYKKLGKNKEEALRFFNLEKELYPK